MSDDIGRTAVIGCAVSVSVVLLFAGCAAVVDAIVPTTQPAPTPKVSVSRSATVSPTPTESDDGEANDAVMRTVKPRKTTRRPTPTPRPTKRETTAPTVRTVTPGAYCSPTGAIGRANGRTYTCKGPGRTRWRR